MGPTRQGDATGTGNLTDKYGGGNPAIRLLTRRFLERLEALLPPQTGQLHLLEVGTGEAVIATSLSGAFRSTVALDLPSPRLRQEWLQRPGPVYLEGDAHRLPFPDDSFDVVLCLEVLEHVDYPQRVLAELLRVSRDQVILSVPREPLFRMSNLVTGRHVRSWGNTPGHVNHWSRRSFVQFVEQQAVVVVVESPYPWTLLSAQQRAASA